MVVLTSRRAVVAVALVLGGSAGMLAQAARSVNDGVYTVAQADRGQKTFESACTVCHDVDRFRGADFINSWKNEPVFALFETLSGTMPADNPGALTPQEYADVIAYFLKLNRYPAGASELQGTKDATSTMRIEPLKTAQ